MAASETEDGRRASWREAMAVYRHPRVLGMLFLGFSAGLPFLLIFATLSAWLREDGITATAIGFFSWAGITFSIKVLWAPIVDRLPLPFLTRRLGRRRSWMFFGQVGIAAGLVGIALSEPSAQIAWVAVLAVTIAFFSATQDVAIDAYRIEAVEKEVQGAMAASYILGYRVALLTGGAGALYLADFISWTAAYLIMAALMGVGMAAVFCIREPESTRDLAKLVAADMPEGLRTRNLSPRLKMTLAWLHSAVACPFIDFFQRYGRMALLILLFVAVYRMSDITMSVMANPFYIDLGFTKTQIANITKLYGFAMAILGAFLGGVLVARLGLMRPLLIGAVMVSASNLAFAWMAVVGADARLLTLAISADNMAGGMAASIFVAYLSSLTSTAYTATQYALFSSLMTLPGKFIGGFSGVVVDIHGYMVFFLASSAVGLPAIALALYFLHRGPPQPMGQLALGGEAERH